MATPPDVPPLNSMGGRGELAPVALPLELIFSSINVCVTFTRDGVGDVGFLQQQDLLGAVLHDFVFEGPEGVRVGGEAHQRGRGTFTRETLSGVKDGACVPLEHKYHIGWLEPHHN
jgi:hypothetical protein